MGSRGIAQGMHITAQCNNLIEIQKLTKNPLEGIKVVLNEQDISDVQAWIAGPVGTPFEGGAFLVRLELIDYPNAAPKGFFVTKIFHPNVSKAGEICVNTLKKDWNFSVGLSQIFLTIKCLLIAPNAESALNEEAGRLILEDYASFSDHAKLWTTLHASNSQIDFSISKVLEKSAEAAEQTSPTKRTVEVLPVKAEKKRSIRRL